MHSPSNIVNYVQLLGERDELAGSIRDVVSGYDKAFLNFEQILSSAGVKLHPSLSRHIEDILTAERVISVSGAEYFVNQAYAISFFGNVEIAKFSREYDWGHKNNKPTIFVSPPSLVPSTLAAEVDDIRNLLIRLVSGAEATLTMLSPFTSTPALASVLRPLQGNGRSISIRVLFSDDLQSAKRQAEALRSILRLDESHKIEFYYRSSDSLKSQTLLHAKILTIDGSHGYLGSANFTEQGIEQHFELGVELGTRQTILVDMIVDRLIENNTFQRL